MFEELNCTTYLSPVYSRKANARTVSNIMYNCFGYVASIFISNEEVARVWNPMKNFGLQDVGYTLKILILSIWLSICPSDDTSIILSICRCEKQVNITARFSLLAESTILVARFVIETVTFHYVPVKPFGDNFIVTPIKTFYVKSTQNSGIKLAFMTYVFFLANKHLILSTCNK